MTTTSQPTADMTVIEMDYAIRGMSPAEQDRVLAYLIGYSRDSQHAPSVTVRRALSEAVASQLDARPAEVSK